MSQSVIARKQLRYTDRDYVFPLGFTVPA